jgi:FkbM family methyltransferase
MSPCLVTIREHTFFSNFLDSHSIVLDAGGNLGGFAHAISRLSGAKVFVLEPVPNLFHQIQGEGEIYKFEMALASQTGIFELNLSSNPESNSLRPLREGSKSGLLCVNGVSLAEFMKKMSIEHIDLLKMDIEGAEIEVLLSLSLDTLSRVGQITVEFHAHTVDLLRDRFVELEKIREVIKYLESAGFMAINRSSPFFIDVLFVNCTLLGISSLKKVYYKLRCEYFYRYANSLIRRLRP